MVGRPSLDKCLRQKVKLLIFDLCEINSDIERYVDDDVDDDVGPTANIISSRQK